MKRDESMKQKGAGKWTPSGDPFFKPYPQLEALLGDRWWDDGKPRQPCTLRIDLVGDGCQLTILDAENRRSWYTMAQSVQQGVQLIEEHLHAGGAAWRPWGKPGKF